MRPATALLFALAFIAGAAAQDHPAQYPDSIGPFAGDWEGLWTVGEDKHPWINAQVIPRGQGAYEVVFTRKLYARAPVFRTVAAQVQGDRLVFDDGEYYGEIKGDSFTGGRRGDKQREFSLQRYTWESPDLGAKPPRNAIVLFDGSDVDEWNKPPSGKFWDIVPGNVLQANPDLGYIETERAFTDVKLHMEFRLPLLPEKRGQSRGNSGVFLQRYFEVQILDSYGLPGYWNECGAIYQVSGPSVNMCAPPLQWQTFDIDFRAARFNRKGELTENPRMTVIHNGVAVQKDIEIPHGTSGDAFKQPVAPPQQPERIRLQAHNNQVQFRNIWVVDLADKR